MGRPKRKAAYAKEYKKFKIRYARKPQDGYPVAGVVAVIDSEGKGFVYIRFSEEFVDSVGKAMPSGVGDESPCFIKAMEVRRSGIWRISAHYIYENKGVLLWESEEKPEWIKHVRRSNHGASKKTTT